MTIAVESTSLDFAGWRFNGSAFARTIGLVMGSPVSRTWKGYWERAEG